jgi:hypothetical protein
MQLPMCFALCHRFHHHSPTASDSSSNNGGFGSGSNGHPAQVPSSSLRRLHQHTASVLNKRPAASL